MAGSFSAFGSYPSPCPLQRSSAPSWHIPAAWTAAKGAVPQVTKRTAKRWQQRRRGQITATGLRPVDRNFRLTTPAEDTNKLTGRPHTAESSGNSNSEPATPRWRLALMLLMLTRRRITVKQNFSCCISCTRYDISPYAREDDIGFFNISVSDFGNHIRPCWCRHDSQRLKTRGTLLLQVRGCTFFSGHRHWFSPRYLAVQCVEAHAAGARCPECGRHGHSAFLLQQL